MRPVSEARKSFGEGVGVGVGAGVGVGVGIAVAVGTGVGVAVGNAVGVGVARVVDLHGVRTRGVKRQDQREQQEPSPSRCPFHSRPPSMMREKANIGAG